MNRAEPVRYTLAQQSRGYILVRFILEGAYCTTLAVSSVARHGPKFCCILEGEYSGAPLLKLCGHLAFEDLVKCPRYREVSSFQGLNYIEKAYLGHSEVSLLQVKSGPRDYLIQRCPYFRDVL